MLILISNYEIPNTIYSKIFYLNQLHIMDIRISKYLYTISYKHYATVRNSPSMAQFELDLTSCQILADSVTDTKIF